jgi:hypothetical protein
MRIPGVVLDVVEIAPAFRAKGAARPSAMHQRREIDWMIRQRWFNADKRDIQPEERRRLHNGRPEWEGARRWQGGQSTEDGEWVECGVKHLFDCQNGSFPVRRFEALVLERRLRLANVRGNHVHETAGKAARLQPGALDVVNVNREIAPEPEAELAPVMTVVCACKLSALEECSDVAARLPLSIPDHRDASERTELVEGDT